MFTLTVSPDKVMEKAERLLEKGKHGRAVQVLQGALDKDPRNTDLLLGLARLYCEIQDPQAALREYRKAFKADPEKAPEILARLAHPEGGVEGVHFLDLRLEIHVHRRDFQEAFDLIAGADTSFLGKLLERAGARIAELRRISSGGQNAGLIADLCCLRGLILESQKLAGRAFVAYREVLEAREEEFVTILPRLKAVVPAIRDQAEPFLFLGDLLRKPEPLVSLRYYGEALDRDPACAKAVIERVGTIAASSPEYWVLGRACLAAGDWEGGVAALQRIGEPEFRPRIVELLKKVDGSRPGTEPAIIFLGDLLLEQGDCSGASRVYTSLSGRVDPALLRDRLTRLMEADPDNMEAAGVFGELCLGQGDLKSSMAQMRKIVQADPSQRALLFDKAFPLLHDHFEDAELCLFLAELSLQEEDVARPLVLLRRFVQLNPEEADRSLPLYQQLIDRDPSNPGIRIGRAEALLASGRSKEALELLRIALTLDPGAFSEAVRDLSLLLRCDPELGHEVFLLVEGLKNKGILHAALPLILGEAALAAGDPRKAVDALLGVVDQSPEQAPVVEPVFQEWARTLPDEVEIRLGLAALCLKAGREEEVPEILSPYAAEHPGDAERMIAFYRGVLQDHPQSPALCQGLLSAYFHGGTPDLVLEQGRRFEKLIPAPRVSAIHLLMGDACREMGRFSESVSWFYQAFKEDAGTAETVAERLSRLLSIHPSLPKGSLALGMVLPACGRVGQGVECLLRLARDLPESRETVMKYLAHISSRHPMSPEPVLAMAEIHILSGAYETAVELLFKAIGREGEDAQRVLNLLDRIVQKDPGIALVHLEVGRVYLQAGLYAKATEGFLRAAEMDRGLWEQAVKFCHDVIAADPAEVRAYEAVSRILTRMGQSMAAVSFLAASAETHPEIRGGLLSCMEEIAGREPGGAEIQGELARTYLQAGRPDAALAAMERALDLDPSCAKQAEALFDALLREAPDGADARMARARCRLHTLNLEGALEDARHALEADSGKIDQGIAVLQAVREKGYKPPELYLCLAECASLRGDPDQAVRLLEEGMEQARDGQSRLPLLLCLAENQERRGDLAAARDALQAARDLSGDPRLYYRKLHDFAMRGIRQEALRLEQEARADPGLAVEKVKRLISHLVLLGREAAALQQVREQTRSRGPEEVREIWGHFHEETGRYALAVRCAGEAGPLRRARLLEQAGEPLLAASALEEAVEAHPDPLLYERLKSCYLSLMEESLSQEKAPLMGETRLRLSAESTPQEPVKA